MLQAKCKVVSLNLAHPVYITLHYIIFAQCHQHLQYEVQERPFALQLQFCLHTKKLICKQYFSEVKVVQWLKYMGSR